MMKIEEDPTTYPDAGIPSAPASTVGGETEENSTTQSTDIVIGLRHVLSLLVPNR